MSPLVRYLPGTLGALCVAAGAAWIYPPAGLLALGAALLLVDRRMP